MTGVYKIQNVLTEFLTTAKNMYLRLYAQSALEKDKKAPAISEAARRAQINVNAEWLFQQYGNSILRMAYSYLHNRSDAEDVLQDTLVQYIKTEPPSRRFLILQSTVLLRNYPKQLGLTSVRCKSCLLKRKKSSLHPTGNRSLRSITPVKIRRFLTGCLPVMRT